VGYTAVRLGGLLAGGAVRRRSLAAVSLEVSPVHVCVARHVLDLAWLAHAVEVKAGQAKDVLGRCGEEHGGRCTGFAFMDHRGTIFHQDFGLLERCGLAAGKVRLVADNTLNPGSPVFLWEEVLRQGRTCIGATPWALTEFLSEHEDWTAVVDRDTG